jgi:predicted RNase H-like HicB family nuclease
MSDELPQLYVDVVQHPDGLVGECLDIPVVVEGLTIKEIREKIHVAIKGYLEAFPERREEIFKKRRTLLSVPIPD